MFAMDQHDGIRWYTQIEPQQRQQRCAPLRPVITKAPYMNLVFAQFSRNSADIRALIRSHARMLPECNGSIQARCLSLAKRGIATVN